MSSTSPESWPTPPPDAPPPMFSEAAPESEVHESRLAPTTEAYKDPENHLFRKKYRQLSMQEAKQMDDIKDMANELYRKIQASMEATTSEKARCSALARTKLEECIMWAVKGITA